MINLLPTNDKEDLIFAKRSTTLLRWVVVLIIGLIGVGAISIAGNVYLNYSTDRLRGEIESTNQSLKDQRIDEVRSELDEISSNTKLTTQVLEREVLFSKLLRKIGSAIPANTTLEQLTVDTVEGGLQLQANATDINAATQLQVNLSDPANGVFEQADIESITCSDEVEGNLPCSVTIKALFLEDNPFVFISDSKQSSSPEKGDGSL